MEKETKASTPKKPHLQQIMSAVRRVDGRRRRRGVLDRRHAGPRPREDLALHGDGGRAPGPLPADERLLPGRALCAHPRLRRRPLPAHGALRARRAARAWHCRRQQQCQWWRPCRAGCGQCGQWYHQPGSCGCHHGRWRRRERWRCGRARGRNQRTRAWLPPTANFIPAHSISPFGFPPLYPFSSSYLRRRAPLSGPAGADCGCCWRRTI